MTIWLACKNQDTAAVQNVETCRQKIIFKNQVKSLLSTPKTTKEFLDAIPS
jgi:hypothetical protein